jgi:subtilisin family serine protease
MRRLLGLVLALTLSLSAAPAISAGPGNTPPGLANKGSQAASEKAAQAKQESQSAARGAAQAAQEAASAAREASQAAQLAPGAAAEQAKAVAAEKAERAKQAGVEAKEKAQAAASAIREAALARAIEKSNGKAARALGKIKGAKEPCVEYLENPTPELAAECEPARYLVRFNNGVDAASQARAMKSARLKVGQVFEDVISGAMVDLTAKELATVSASGRVRSIEEDFTISLNQTQTSPEWGLDRIDQAALPLSSSYTNANPGTGVRVYVVDTGIRSTHQEFSGRVIAGYSAISDGNGTLDCNGHGTHVAGTAAGSTFGVAKSATLVPVRVLGCQGEGSLSGVLAGLDWISKNHPAGAPAVVNMSLGGLASSTLDSAVQSLINRGITVVVAAGNSSSDACLYSPARVSAAITVAASSRTDAFASFSNAGSCVDLVAPGVEIRSAVSTSDTAVATYSGTSMAAPHVAGSIASLMTAGYLTPGEVSFALTQSAVAAITSAPASTTNALLQLTSATSGVIQQPLPADAATAPIAPVIEGVVLSNNAATVRWSISPDGGSPLTSHTVRIWERGQLVKKLSVSATATSARATGLKWGVSYTFTVLATNAIGTSDDSVTSQVITPTRR